MSIGRVKYARNGDIRLAYRQMGDGDIPVVLIPGWVSNIDLVEDPTSLYAGIAERLSQHVRLVIWDKRGTGLSDPVTHVPSIDERMDDLRAVLDAAEVDRPAIVGISEGGPMSIVFAATYPERVRSLVLVGTTVRFSQELPDFPWGYTPEQVAAGLADIDNHWGEGALADLFFGPIADVPGVREMFGKEQRACASPMMARMMWQAVFEIDVRAVLGSVRTPTMVLARRGDRIASFEGAEALAAGIPNAELRELPPGEHYAVDLIDLLPQTVLEFVGQQADARPAERVLSAVLFTDIVGSTELLAAQGDEHWRRHLDDHDRMVDRVLARYGGRRAKHTGDGVFALFDGPTKAARCGLDLVPALATHGIPIRAGVHIGECEKRGDEWSGMAVHVGARIGAMAGAGEVLTSRTVRDLSVGSGLVFEDLGNTSSQGTARGHRGLPRQGRLTPRQSGTPISLRAVITRMSELFLRTLRDDPADAEVPSHKLLIRAGYIRPVGPGLYSWLPMGLRVLRKVERVVRDEMNAIGGQEILFPALLPRAPYETTNRWTEYGDGVFRLKDRRGNDYLLGPTHEELFTLTVKGEYSSYKDFPLLVYQIQTKYRDEARPRAGILRGREFVMKDSYSFDVDDDGLRAVYHRHRDAYQRIFDKLGVRYVIVSAVSGAMGGSASEEFLAESDVGEDTFVRCLQSGYAANVEAVITAVPEALPIEGLPEAKVHDTPDTPTIATLVEWANSVGLGREITAADTLKNVLLKVRQPGGEWELLAVGVPGDREVDEKRLGAALDPAEYALLDDADFAKNPFLVKGYVGPKALKANGVRYLLDPRIVDGTSWITGADTPNQHVVDLVAGRDFVADGTIEAAEVRDGDPSPDGAGPLVSARGIEIGHIFQLGRKYTDAFSADVLGEDGKPVRLTMGSYGIGVSRLVAVIAEQHHDEIGLRWPSSVSPFDAHVVIANKDDAARAGAAELVADLDGLGLEVLLDDRKSSPGVKFKDAELLGIPWIVVVGRGWADGVVELRNRFSGETREVAVDNAATEIAEAIAG